MIEMSIEKETALTGDGAISGPVKALSRSPVAPVSIDTPFMADMVLAEVPANAALTEEMGHDDETSKANKVSRVKSGTHKVAKRRYSMNAGFKHPGFSKRRRRANSECDPVLPSKFLLGGNIFDPLNLNSLLDEEVNRVQNAETPKSSPLPSKSREPVEILIPRDITDPLNLSGKGGHTNGGVLVSPLKKRRHRNRHHGGSGGHLEPSDSEKTTGAEQEGAPFPAVHLAVEQTGESPRPYELNTSINCRDEVVAPILPRCRSSRSAPRTGSSSSTAQASKQKQRRRTIGRSERLSVTPTPSNKKLHLDRGRSQTFHTPVVGGAAGGFVGAPRHVAHNRRKPRREYHYGTYSCYYGYRTPTLNVDPRLAAFRPEWFLGKNVLDIGCNVGHVTLAIAKHWCPAHILGLDIDGGVIHAARQNLRHFLSELRNQEVGGGDVATFRTFPVSFRLLRGPIAAPPVLPLAPGVFPNNVSFKKGNYVPDSDVVVMSESAVYDVIVCMNMTQWVQLNWGDVGLQRLFRRVYTQLNPGGMFLLQPQPWSSYSLRKRLTETTHRNYNSIRLRPDRFSSYLTSEVGFTSYELISATKSCSKGSQRPIYLFHKGPASSKRSSSRRGSDLQEEEKERL